MWVEERMDPDQDQDAASGQGNLRPPLTPFLGRSYMRDSVLARAPWWRVHPGYLERCDGVRVGQSPTGHGSWVTFPANSSGESGTSEDQPKRVAKTLDRDYPLKRPSYAAGQVWMFSNGITRLVTDSFYGLEGSEAEDRGIAVLVDGFGAPWAPTDLPPEDWWWGRKSEALPKEVTQDEALPVPDIAIVDQILKQLSTRDMAAWQVFRHLMEINYVGPWTWDHKASVWYRFDPFEPRCEVHIRGPQEIVAVTQSRTGGKPTDLLHLGFMVGTKPHDSLGAAMLYIDTFLISKGKTLVGPIPTVIQGSVATPGG